MADTAVAGRATSPSLAGVRVLVVSNERVAARMAGPAIRALQLARQLAARGAAVTLAAPELPEIEMGDDDQARASEPRLERAAFGTPSARSFRALADAHDVVVCQPQRMDVLRGLAKSRARLVFDLYVPSFVERIAQLATEPGDERVRRQLLERDRLEYAHAVAIGDAFVCASERQRDHWLGALGQAGRLDLELPVRDPDARSLLDVVAFGVDAPPTPLAAAGEGAVRGRLVPDDAVVLLWTGGLWNWLDPVLVVEALAAARETEPRLHLVVMGFKHPEEHWQEQEASRRMRERAGELGLLDSGAVVLCDEWVPYAERGRFLLDADTAVSAHHEGLETRLSYRTRLLDHLWAGLPSIVTSGDDLARELDAAGAAISVAPGDVAGWVEAMRRIASDPDLREQMSTAAATLAKQHRWERTSEPLARIVAEQAARVASPARRDASLAARLRYAWLLVRVRVRTKGLGSLGAAVRGARSR
ncbi:MAG: glycosyltransferase family 4 protein [Thermoleophilia bacterium]|nr:glycosyltransferase family 4 protein [Thermoleophilia bacterium]